MRIFRILGAIGAVAIAAMTFGHSANAAIYTLSVNGCSSGCGTGPWGTVTVTQDADHKSLDFVVALNTGFKFHENPDKNHHAFVFDLVNDPAVTITNLSAGFTRNTTQLKASPFGTFDYAINCTGCGHGYNGGKAGPLDFKVTPTAGALGLASLAANLYTAQTKIERILFATDIVTLPALGGGTGNVGAEEVEGVPELSTWAMMIIGFGGVALRLRRRGDAIAQTA